jgi:hypothetical protein
MKHKTLGRPINKNSKRQKLIAKRLAKKSQLGYIPLGRPIKKNSKRQLSFLVKSIQQAFGIKSKRGRPTLSETERKRNLYKRKHEIAKALKSINLTVSKQAGNKIIFTTMLVK